MHFVLVNVWLNNNWTYFVCTKKPNIDNYCNSCCCQKQGVTLLRKVRRIKKEKPSVTKNCDNDRTLNAEFIHTTWKQWQYNYDLCLWLVSPVLWIRLILLGAVIVIHKIVDKNTVGFDRNGHLYFVSALTSWEVFVCINRANFFPFFAFIIIAFIVELDVWFWINYVEPRCLVNFHIVYSM